MKLLLVEDDRRIAEFILKGLKQEGYVLDHAGDGEDGLRLAAERDYDAAIVDVMLPKLDGLELVERLRVMERRTPVLILSAKREVDDRVRGLQKGGDDYLTKPFAFSELVARVQALIRRSTGESEPTRLVVADLEIDLLGRIVTRGGEQVELQARESDLLRYLVRNEGRVVSKTMIAEQVWGFNFDPRTNVVEARVCKLREKIDCGHQVKLIHTIRGAGYVVKQGA